MASTTLTIRLPRTLHEAAKKRSGALKYRTIAAYVKGLVRFDMLVQGQHAVTLPMSNLPDDEQDAIDKELLVLTERGVGTRGELLAHIVADITKLGKDVTGEEILEVLRKACGSKSAPPKPGSNPTPATP